jgi:hypothetical protein
MPLLERKKSSLEDTGHIRYLQHVNEHGGSALTVDNHVAGKIAYLDGLRGIAMLPSRVATKLAFFPVRR